MSNDDTIARRQFVKLCATAVATVSASPEVLAHAKGVRRSYGRALLTWESHRPVKTSELIVGESYLFQYPYVSTPCFLVNLGRPAPGRVRLETRDGTDYDWQGGTGPQQSIVSFSAICAHRMSHPTRSVSFINFRQDTARFRDTDFALKERPQVIYCCSEKSVYDPARGARVLGGPAPQPLASILLEHDTSEDRLYAVGTYGGEMFDDYFTKFSDRLKLEYQTEAIATLVESRTTVVTVAEFCRQQILC